MEFNSCDLFLLARWLGFWDTCTLTISLWHLYFYTMRAVVNTDDLLAELNSAASCRIVKMRRCLLVFRLCSTECLSEAFWDTSHLNSRAIRESRSIMNQRVSNKFPGWLVEQEQSGYLGDKD